MALCAGLVLGCAASRSALSGAFDRPTLVPAPYDWDYTITATVSSKRARVASYQRQATLTNWCEAFLIFVYPFYPLDGKREEIFSESLHDLFKQIEADKILE